MLISVKVFLNQLQRFFSFFAEGGLVVGVFGVDKFFVLGGDHFFHSLVAGLGF